MTSLRYRSAYAIGLLLLLAVVVGCGGEAVGGMGGITGTLTDATTGDALAGVRIRCEDTTSGEPAESITDASGRFIIADLLTGEARLGITVSGYEPLRGHRVAVVGGTVTEVDLSLSPRDGQPATIRGTVTGPDGPLAGARVSAAAARTRTDRAGGYELHLPRATEDVVVTFEAPGYAAVTRVVAIGSIHQGRTVLDIALNGGGRRSLRGVIIDAHDGEPVEGATVTCGSRTTRTDAAGAFTLEGLPDGPLTIRCAARGYRDESRRIGPADELSGLIAIPLVSPSTGEIAVRAIDATTSGPVQGVTVLTEPLGRRAVTDEQGRARIDHVPAGSYWLEYRGEGIRKGRTGPLYVDPVEWPRVELPIEPVSARIVGALRDAAGAPVANHAVLAEPAEGDHALQPLTTETDDEGRFVLADLALDRIGGLWRLTPEGGAASARIEVTPGATANAGPLTYVP
jgi:hypothetical protein